MEPLPVHVSSERASSARADPPGGGLAASSSSSSFPRTPVRAVSVRRHAALRADPDFEPTRVGAVRIDVLRVDTVRCAFDHASGEFNVARFTRELAAGKVRAALDEDEAMPNTLRVQLMSADGLPPGKTVFVVVSVRGLRRQTATRMVLTRTCVWNEHFTFPCPDPSAVLHVGVYENARGLSGRTVLLRATRPFKGPRGSRAVSRVPDWISLELKRRPS